MEKFESGMENFESGIRYKHPGSATLSRQMFFYLIFMTKKKAFDQTSHEISSKIPTKDIQAPAKIPAQHKNFSNMKFRHIFPF
jgi:hypothetical protein